MTEKIFITDDNTVTLVCPECGRSKAADVSEYRQLDKAVRLKIKCSCGNSYSAILERREQYRKETNLPGKYIRSLSSGEQEEGTLTITNVSRIGLRLKVNVKPNFKVGAKFVVEFLLGDKQGTLIRKEVIVKMISGVIIGTEFCSVSLSDPSDKAIGFYLLQ